MSENKKPILWTLLFFLVSYIAFLVFWIGVKDFYAQGITFVASKIVGGIKDVRFEGMERVGDEIELTFSPLRYSRMLIDIPVKTSSYTFNAPLTLAIIAALSRFIKRRGRACGEALFMLLSVHILYVASLEAKLLTDILTDRGLERSSGLLSFLYEFLWGFTDNMIMRFEPFLIGFYIFARYRG